MREAKIGKPLDTSSKTTVLCTSIKKAGSNPQLACQSHPKGLQNSLSDSTEAVTTGPWPNKSGALRQRAQNPRCTPIAGEKNTPCRGPRPYPVIYLYIYIYTYMERKTEKERERERQRKGKREGEREKERERKRERERERKRVRER